MRWRLRGLSFLVVVSLFAGDGRAAERTPAGKFKVALVEAMESGSDARVRRNVVTALRRATVRNPEKILSFTKLSIKATKARHRGAPQRDREVFVTDFLVAAMKGYYERVPRFDRKLYKSLTAVLKSMPADTFSEDFVDRLYLRLLPIQLAANQDPEVLRSLLEEALRIIDGW